MPRTGLRTSTALAIELQVDDPKTARYAPGDTIIGCVVRKQAAVSPAASVSITLHGRTKSKITVSRGQHGTTYYRARFDLFPAKTETIFRGPVHVEQSSHSVQRWPFAITIPEVSDPATASRDNSQEYSSLPLNVPHPLPATFYADASRSLSASTGEGYVEYYLEASLFLTGSKTIGGNSKAALPILVQPLHTDPTPLTDFGLQRTRRFTSFASQRLVPGMQDAQLSFHDKTRKFFGSSKIPRFKFDLFIELPTLLQLDNPNPFSLRVLAKADRERTTDILRDVPQALKIESLTLTLRSMTWVQCPGTLSEHSSEGHEKHALNLFSSIRRLPEPLLIPCAMSPGDGTQPLDLGPKLDLRISNNGLVGRSPTAWAAGLTPGFTTYNIKHSHRLQWDISVSCAGESETYSGGGPLTLLPPSSILSNWVRPPAEQPLAVEGAPASLAGDDDWVEPPPPAFEDVVREGAGKVEVSSKAA